MNSVFIIFEIVLLVVIIIGFVGYVITTNHIIKSQDQEIRELHNELTKSKRAVRVSHSNNDIKFGD